MLLMCKMGISVGWLPVFGSEYVISSLKPPKISIYQVYHETKVYYFNTSGNIAPPPHWKYLEYGPRQKDRQWNGA